MFDVAADMVRMCPALSKRVKILASQKRLIYTPTNSFYQVLSAEAYSKHGFNIHGVVFDELHTQPNRKLFDVMTKGSGDARMQPLYFLITTAGTDTHSICYETHQKAKDIIEGRKIDPTFYPVIYGADESDDWTDPKVWKKANPSLDITVGIDKVKAACESAKQNPGEENAFRQLRLNQWVKQAVRWMPMEKWDKCAFAVDEDELEGRVCYGGLDLSSTTDITAFVLVFPPLDEEDKYVILPYFWIPEDNLTLRVNRDHVPYDVWERQGYLQTTEGNVVHYGFIEQFIERLGERFNIREIAFDRWGAVQMVQNLEGISNRYGGLDNLGDKLMKSENMEMALDEIIWLITLLCNQSIEIHNLRNSEKKPLLTEETVELLTSPGELAEYKDAITEAMLKGTKRNIESDDTSKNAVTAE